jgi:hypothetical protein
VERIAMCMSKLRRLNAIEDALFHKARIAATRRRWDRQLSKSIGELMALKANALIL